jgi:Holliday junction DNA helicase RuvA
MIGSLRGTLLEVLPGPTAGELLIEAGGVGYRVAVPSGTLAMATVGSGFFVHVHTHVREDAIILYGFATREERICFDALLSVHGVGPALALALLSTHAPAVLQRIVVTEDADALTLVPGVGKKTAVRLILELQAKFDILPATGLALVGASDPFADVRAALAGLGYGADEIREVLRTLPEGGSTDELLRHALRQLAVAR